MGKKLEALTSGLMESQLAQTVRESTHQIWMAGLGAYSITQDEGSKMFGALVKEGEVIQAQTLKMADEKIAMVAGKAVGTWDRIEHVVENRIARTLNTLGVPTKRDISKLSKNVVELSAVVQKLADGKVAQRPER